ncbi:DUF1918 domain-containing protein [Streptacidiphilus neutrinimicus]|uniref:DUF1918 domain-containing protein n=1 Tax=Streptacidiphilus neutrinimicus TaxID=105420 RepID=UPI0005A776C1|nr:DUF1918 domain-containing protein [Streptacidiphilus neutrinimicus]
MQAARGDWLSMQGRAAAYGKVARITEVLGEAGAPPYRVEYPDGRSAVVGPGPGSRIRCVKQRVETVHPDASYL